MIARQRHVFIPVTAVFGRDWAKENLIHKLLQTEQHKNASSHLCRRNFQQLRLWARRYTCLKILKFNIEQVRDQWAKPICRRPLRIYCMYNFQEDCSEIIEVAETEDDSNVLQQQCPAQLQNCKEEEVGCCSSIWKLIDEVNDMH